MRARTAAERAKNAAEQRLRYLERRLRVARRLEAVALDDAARLLARAKVRNYQALIRAHVAGTSAERQPDRERLGTPGTVRRRRLRPAKV